MYIYIKNIHIVASITLKLGSCVTPKPNLPLASNLHPCTHNLAKLLYCCVVPTHIDFEFLSIIYIYII
jgi:hypothetical protein